MGKRQGEMVRGGRSQTQSIEQPTAAQQSKGLRRRRWLAPMLALCGMCIVLYINTLGHDYALDDAIVITQNKFTQRGVRGIVDIFSYDTFIGFWMTSYPDKSAEAIQETKKLVAGGRYRPLSLATFALEVDLFGKTVKNDDGKVLYKGNPFVSHLNNMLLYMLTTLLLYVIMRRLVPDGTRKWYFSFSFLAALLFLAHPLHTEAVANVKGRDEIMTLLGSLAALWFTLRYLDTSKLYNTILAGVCLFAGLLSKEIAIAFLAIIPITVHYFTRCPLRKNLKACISLLVAAVIFLIIRASILGFSGEKEISAEILNNPFIHATATQKFATIFYTLWMYIKLLIFPAALTYDYYPHQIEIIDFSSPTAILSLLLYVCLGIYALYGLLRKRDLYSYSIWFYLLPLSVVSNIIFPVGTFMNERFVFISSIGFCTAIAWLLSHNVPKWIKSDKLSCSITSLVMIIVVGLYTAKTIDRNRAWHDDLTLFTTDVQTSTNSAKSNCSAGGKILEHAQEKAIKADKPVHDSLCEKAIFYLKRAVEIYPTYTDALNLLGNAYFEYDYDVATALRYYTQALRVSSFHRESYGNAKIVISNAFSLLDTGTIGSSYADIVAATKSLLELHPELGEAYHLTGTLYGRYLNELDSCLLYLQKAEKCDFDKTHGFYKDLGVAYGLSGNYQASAESLLKALEYDPDDFQTCMNLGATYSYLGDVEKAQFYVSKGQLLKQQNDDK